MAATPLSNTGLNTHPAGSTGLNATICGNWERLDELFKHTLASSDTNYLQFAKALLREALTSPSLTAGETIFYSAQLSKYTRRPASATAPASAGALAFNYGLLAPVLTLAISGAYTFGSVTNPTAGQKCEIIIQASGGPHNLTFPGAGGSWRWLTAVPASIASGKNAILRLYAYGTSTDNVYAEWVVQP